ETLPSYLNATNIMTFQHHGSFINSNLLFDVDLSVSDIKEKSKEVKDHEHFKDKIAFTTQFTFNIPNTSFLITGTYEHVAKDFENNSLPFNLTGIDRFSSSVSGYVLSNKLFVNLNFNFFKNENI